MKTFDEVMQEINSLTTDEIVDLFTSEGITGERTDSCNCPVSNYVKQQTKFAMVSTGPCDVAAWRTWPSSTDHSKIDLSSSAQKFIREFDIGKYPQLIKSD